MPRQGIAAVLLMVTCALGVHTGRAEPAPPVLFPGHSGIWYDPSRNGEGYVLELISSSAATLTWFTYDESGEQRWLFGVGKVVQTATGGTFLQFDELYDTSGGVFGDAFDPSRVERRLVGSARIEFADCSIGQFAYEAYGTSGSVPIQRIATAMGLDCAPVHGSPDAALAEYAGESGSWYDPSHNGEGFQLQWTTSDQALLTWYSYDDQGQQYWMTGVGSRDPEGRIVFDSLIATRGAQFGSAFDPDDVERFHWGSLTLEFDCAVGQAVYTSDIPGFDPGTQALTRITALLGHDCPWQAAALSDIYEVTLTRIPTILSTEGGTKSLQVFSIADDGTLIGGFPNDAGFQLLRLLPGASIWEAMTDHILAAVPFQISPDSTRILVNEFSGSGGSFAPLLWDPAGGLRPLTNLIFDENYGLGGSLNLTFVFGVGRPTGDVSSYPWVWSEATGQVELPLSDEIRLPTPLAVSETGDTVIGYSLSPGEDGFMAASGIRWHGLNEPTYLFDTLGTRLGPAIACSADCGVVFGSGHFDTQEDHPFRDQAWVMLPDGTVRYLENPAGDPPLEAPTTRQTTADGSMLVGSYAVGTPQGIVRAEPFLWTRLTGSVGLRELAISLDDSIQRWDDLRAMDVSSDGSLVLLLGEEMPGGQSSIVFQAAVLELRPIAVGEPTTSLGKRE